MDTWSTPGAVQSCSPAHRRYWTSSVLAENLCRKVFLHTDALHAQKIWVNPHVTFGLTPETCEAS